MENFLLSSFSLMALIILLTALVFFVALIRSPYRAGYKRWMMIYFIGLLSWHSMGFISGGFHSELREMTYRFTNTFFNMGLSISLVAIIHISYLFPEPGFDRERKWVSPISLLICSFYVFGILWYHFLRNQQGANSTNYGAFVNGLSGIVSLLINSWATLVFFRKYLLFRKHKSQYSTPCFLLGSAQLFIVIISLLFISPGAGHPMVLPLYIYGLWLLLQLQCILFIVYSVFPIPFKTKLLGFTLATVMAILSVTIMAIVPFTTNSEAPENLAQRIADQPTLQKLTMVIMSSFVFIIWMFPVILKTNLIEPLNKLVQGMKKANEGDLSVSLPEGVLDEIGIVTRNFNKMVASLKVSKEELENYANTLEQQVEKRTEELSNSLKELKSTQTQLIQSEKLASLGELTAGIAHEIQNPLNFVNNFSELSVDLAQEIKEEIDKIEIQEKDKAYLDELLTDLGQNQEKINLHGKRASSIVTGMLQHARTSTGAKEPTDINALADEYLRLSYHGLRAKDPNFNAKMVTDFDPAVGKVDVIPQDIGRVLLNLINNAFYAVMQRERQLPESLKLSGSYMPTVAISTQKTDSQIIIKITDNGTGIPDDVKAKIFQPFFTTKPTGQGTGLGLSLAYDIVTKGHGGTMRLETKEGEGAEFVIQLPC